MKMKNNIHITVFCFAIVCAGIIATGCGKNVPAKFRVVNPDTVSVYESFTNDGSELQSYIVAVNDASFDIKSLGALQATDYETINVVSNIIRITETCVYSNYGGVSWKTNTDTAAYCRNIKRGVKLQIDWRDIRDVQKVYLEPTAGL